MKITIEITEEDLNQAIHKAVEKFLSLRIEDTLRESNELWDQIDEGVIRFVQSQKTADLVIQAIEETKGAIAETVSKRMLDAFI
jgi:hypothetical protein